MNKLAKTDRSVAHPDELQHLHRITLFIDDALLRSIASSVTTMQTLGGLDDDVYLFKGALSQAVHQGIPGVAMYTDEELKCLTIRPVSIG